MDVSEDIGFGPFHRRHDEFDDFMRERPRFADDFV